MNSIKVDQAISQQIFQIILKASLENLNPGDILQGRVQSLDNGLLLIKLLDGASFTANVPEGFTASMGAWITLEVGQRQNDQLTARIVSNSNDQSMINKVLEQPTITNLIEKNLSSQGVAPSDKLISGVLELLKAEPGIPINQASFLVANRLDPDTEMLKIIHKISEHEFQLHENLQSLKEGLLKAFTQIDPTIGQKALKQLLVSQELEGFSQNLKQMLSEFSPGIKESILENVRETLIKAMLDSTEAQENVNPSRLLDQKGLVDFLKHTLNSLEGKGLDKESGANLPLLTPDEVDSLIKVIYKALEDIHNKSDGLIKGDAKEVEALLEKLFDKAVIKVEGGTLEDVDIKDKAKALREIMNFSQKALNQMDLKTQDMNLPAFKEIDNAFRFFNQVTTYDALIQIPIKINKEHTTGELYVMKRKRGRKKLDSENFTLFLSLQTSSLGHIESFLNASKKCVTISFRVEHEDLVKLVKDQHRALHDGLLNKGYKLAEMRCRVLEKDEVGLLDAAQRTQELLGLQSSVDIKI